MNGIVRLYTVCVSIFRVLRTFRGEEEERKEAQNETLLARARDPDFIQALPCYLHVGRVVGYLFC
jgi:hypothetical protein